MIIRRVLMLVLLCISVPAVAQMVTIERAYEIAVDDLRLPGNVVGSVSFKDCNTCAKQTVRVTTETRYVLNNRDVSLVEFRKAVNSIVNKDTNIATVIHHLASDSIVAVHVVK